jgi:malate permease and related proteins
MIRPSIMEIAATIIPIFTIVCLGWVAHRKGFMPAEFLGPANRIVYYLAIPAMIFRALSKASLGQEFHGAVLFITLASAAGAYLVAWGICHGQRDAGPRAGIFIQSAGHGNLGYIGLSVAFYYLGETGLVRAGLIAGFLMILQNVLSVFVLQAHHPGRQGPGARSLLKALLGNPVIISALAGILASALEIPIPIVIQRSLDILSGLALPTALLLIGASLSFRVMRDHIVSVMGSVVIKLMLLPGLGLALYRLFDVPPADYLPGLILLASPTATVAYVMAKEMRGDTDFAVAAISASTLISAGTFSFWLILAGRLG